MKEKERYEWDEIKCCEFIRDTGIDNRPLYYDLKAVAHILNQQEKRIKELEEENQQLKKQLEEYHGWLDRFHLNPYQLMNLIIGLQKENEEFKQSQQQLAISELEKIKTKFNGKRPIDELASEIEIELGYTATQINNFVENQIEKLKGNNE